MQIAGGVIEFLCPAAPTSETRFGLDHIAFIVDDLDAAFEQLVAAGFEFSVTPKWPVPGDVEETAAYLQSRGVQFAGSPKPAGNGYGRVATFLDPDGAKIEILDRADLREL